MEHREPFYMEDLEEESYFNLKEELQKYTRYWPWFLLSAIVAMSLAYSYLSYTPKQYKVSTTILIKDDKKGSLLSELSVFEDLGGLSGAKSNVDNEIEILKSRSILQAVVKELQLNTRFFTEETLINTELFGSESPLKVQLSERASQWEATDTLVYINILSSTAFTLINGDRTQEYSGAFGKQVATAFGPITLLPSGSGSGEFPQEITLILQPVKNVVTALKKEIQIGVVNKKTSVVSLSLIGANKRKAAAILDELVTVYNKNAITDKNEVSKNTAAFINNRLLIITKDLNKVDVHVEQFKQTNKLTDITSEAGLFLENASTTAQELLRAKTQLQLIEYMTTYLKENADSQSLIPASLGFSDPAISAVGAQYNKLILDRNRLLKNSSAINPVVVNINDQLLQLRGNLTASLSNLKASMHLKINSLASFENRIKAKIASVPKQERVYRDIQRQQQIKEALYLYLLQKREETAISLAVTVANAKIIDRAYGSDLPVSPKRKIVLLAGLLLGLLLPAVVIYIRDLLDTKIHLQREMETVKAPFLGGIPLMEKSELGLGVNTSNNSISEAFRILRTSVNFRLKNSTEKGKVLMVGSTVSGEGKTFVAINLAASLAISGKKVLLVGMDFRSPKLAQYLSLKQHKGLVNYIVNDITHWEEGLNENVEVENLSVLNAGDIPPNPSELLMHEKIAVFFKEARTRYDYVIVDSAPVGLVTDTLLINEYADLFIYICKANYSEKRALDFIQNLVTEKKIPNLALVLNGTDISKGYGYGYGYGDVPNATKKNRFTAMFK